MKKLFSAVLAAAFLTAGFSIATPSVSYAADSVVKVESKKAKKKADKPAKEKKTKKSKKK